MIIHNSIGHIMILRNIDVTRIYGNTVSIHYPISIFKLYTIAILCYPIGTWYINLLHQFDNM